MIENKLTIFRISDNEYGLDANIDGPRPVTPLSFALSFVHSTTLVPHTFAVNRINYAPPVPFREPRRWSDATYWTG